MRDPPVFGDIHHHVQRTCSLSNKTVDVSPRRAAASLSVCSLRRCIRCPMHRLSYTTFDVTSSALGFHQDIRVLNHRHQTLPSLTYLVSRPLPLDRRVSQTTYFQVRRICLRTTFSSSSTTISLVSSSRIPLLRLLRQPWAVSAPSISSFCVAQSSLRPCLLILQTLMHG